MENKEIIHIIKNEKFTSGYIDFMMRFMKDYKHKFFIIGQDKKLNLKHAEYYKNISELGSAKELLSKETRKRFYECDKIIVSGILDGIERFLIKLPRSITSKMYLQFWGADFYFYRDTKIFSKKFLRKIRMKLFINKCGGIINLIEDDYNELTKVFPNNIKHFVGVMPDDPREEERFINYLNFDEKNDKKNIIVGNSATVENNHIETFEMLEHLKNYDLKIISPLSYGEPEYREIVIKRGKEIFGDKFIPVTEFMSYDNYLKLLSECSVGIFNNNRQQGMGNINALLKIGKKVYLKKNTSMWEEYTKNDLKVFNIEEIRRSSYEELFDFDIKFKKSNYDNIVKRENKWEEQWKLILEN